MSEGAVEMKTWSVQLSDGGGGEPQTRPGKWQPLD